MIVLCGFFAVCAVIIFVDTFCACVRMDRAEREARASDQGARRGPEASPPTPSGPRVRHYCTRGDR